MHSIAIKPNERFFFFFNVSSYYNKFELHRFEPTLAISTYWSFRKLKYNILWLAMNNRAHITRDLELRRTYDYLRYLQDLNTMIFGT